MKLLHLILISMLWGMTARAQDFLTDTTLLIQNKYFRIQAIVGPTDSLTLTIFRDSKRLKTDTLFAGGMAPLKFPDFDKDGNPDILLLYMGNNFIYSLNLFDPVSERFQFVEGFDRFPEAEQLQTQSRYYYSYHRAGCADYNWESDLFYIDQFKTIHIGNIYGKGCNAYDESDPGSEVEDDPPVIEIYKVNNKGENETLVEKLPYLENIPGFGDKWDFIKKYWEMNYRKFESH